MGAVFQHLFGTIQFGTIIFWAVIALVGGMFLFMASLQGFCLIMIERLYRRTKGYNCLYWKHADHTAEGMDCMELRKIYLDEGQFTKVYFAQMQWPLAKKAYESKPKRFLSPARESKIPLYEYRLKTTKQAYGDQRKGYLTNAQDWDYKETWWQFWKVSVKWVYEEKQKDGTFKIKPFEPDRVISDYVAKEYPVVKSRTLADELIESQDWLIVYKKSMKWLQTLALAAPVFLGIAFVIGIIFLGVILIGETKESAKAAETSWLMIRGLL